MLQVLYVCAFVVSCVAFVLSAFVPNLSFFGSLGGMCVVMVAFPGYLHLYSCHKILVFYIERIYRFINMCQAIRH